MSFLTLNEKRAAVGYAPLDEPLSPATEDGAPTVLAKYRPDQARAPRGDPDGGQWVDEGGGGSGSRVGTSVASGAATPARDDRARERRVRVADASEADAARSRYSRDKPGWHEYGTENIVCPVELQCTEEEMRDQTPRAAFPNQDPSVPVKNRDVSFVYDPDTGLPGGFIRTYALDGGLTIINQTLPIHVLYYGIVERRARRNEDGSWSVISRGTGNNIYPGMNSLNERLGPEIFNRLDERLRENIVRSRDKKSHEADAIAGHRLRRGHNAVGAYSNG